MTAPRFVGLLALVSILTTGSVAAEEETLKFRLIITTISGNFFDAPDIEGQSVGTFQKAGVAVFEDGRLAFKQFVVSIDNRGAEGNYAGYSTYTFQKGDSLTLKFTGEWGPKGDGGDYEVLSGTGDYEGATGTGRFDAVKNAWDDALLYDGSITIVRGGN